ncbi:hypothetical protein AURDEDRAFT_114523 [Auricularia subglabra TFB-10046 SS5]|nr:hypothetical protein AURDEDRAFT_114523 [Auricularia subglabra TFB-10046 SS5]
MGSGRISFAALGGAFTPIHAPQPVRPAAAAHARKSSASSVASVPSRPYTPVELVQLAHDAAHPAAPNSDAPAFTQLADDVLLPFIDRPQEVATLIASHPTSKLLTLLSKTLPAEGPKDGPPAEWSFEQLDHWMTAVDRAEADDVSWVASIRACVAPRSELVWERLKGALGVPPELDADVSDPAPSGDDVFVDIEPVFLDSTPGSPDGPIAEDPIDTEAIQGLRILSSPTFAASSPAIDSADRPKPISAHAHGTPRPHFPRNFSDVSQQGGTPPLVSPPVLSRSNTGHSSRSASPVPSPGSNYAHFVAQRLLNNNSPSHSRRVHQAHE